MAKASDELTDELLSIVKKHQSISNKYDEDDFSDITHKEMFEEGRLDLAQHILRKYYKIETNDES